MVTGLTTPNRGTTVPADAHWLFVTDQPGILDDAGIVTDADPGAGLEVLDSFAEYDDDEGISVIGGSFIAVLKFRSWSVATCLAIIAGGRTLDACLILIPLGALLSLAYLPAHCDRLCWASTRTTPAKST